MNSIRSLFSHLGLRLGVPRVQESHLMLPAYSPDRFVRCPRCSSPSSRVHSVYTRVLRDLPVGAYSIKIHLKVRKFYCRNPACATKIFSEQPGNEVVPYARNTLRTQRLLEKVLAETSSCKGAKLTKYLGISVSPSTALRILRAIPLENVGLITKLGIDDWAFRKGISYGTILVNMDTGKVVDILSGRDGKELKQWLRAHPEIESVCRDRSSAYAAAVREVIPAARQVADRFHLLRNLSDAVYEVIRSEPLITTPMPAVKLTPERPSDGSKEEIAQRGKGECSPQRKELFYKVKELREKGLCIRAIARTLCISRNTVRRYDALKEPPIKTIPLRNDYAQFSQLIESQLSEGKTLTAVFRTIVQNGFTGGYTAFREQFKRNPGRSQRALISNHYAFLSPRMITIYLTYKDLDSIKKENDRTQMKHLIQNNELIHSLKDLVSSFRDILLEGTPDLLHKWMQKVLDLGKKRLNKLINGMELDLEAITNAITTKLNSGMVEGNVNRLKNIKRQMYGRASLDLLKRKVILSKTG